MPRPLTLLLVALSIAVATAAGLAAPRLLPHIDQAVAGLVVFLLLAVGHLALVLGRERSAQARDFAEAKAAARAALTESGTLRARLDKLVEDLEGRAETRNAELVSEMQVLQGLLTRTASKPQRDADATARAAAPTLAAPTIGIEVDETGPAPPPRALTRPTTAPDHSAAPAEIGEEASDLEVFEIVREAIEENRIDLYVQPLVALPQRRPRFYETFGRIRDAYGAVVRPQRYLPVAGRAGLLGTLDNLLLFRCLQLIRQLRRKARPLPFIVNISSNTLRDTDFLPQFIDFMEHNLSLADALVFEFAQEDLGDLLGPLAGDLARLAQYGFTFSLDHVTHLDLDVEALAAAAFRTVKLDADTFLTYPVEAKVLRGHLAARGIDLVIEKVEDERTAIALLDHGVTLAQGHLFGEPRLARELFS
jgi:cyclic-di-GMP phosphodiesterase TipF (flagellum assembly factor)